MLENDFDLDFFRFFIVVVKFGFVVVCFFWFVVFELNFLGIVSFFVILGLRVIIRFFVVFDMDFISLFSFDNLLFFDFDELFLFLVIGELLVEFVFELEMLFFCGFIFVLIDYGIILMIWYSLFLVRCFGWNLVIVIL